MIIKRSKEMERKVLDKIKAHLERAPRSLDKWHVSDLLYPRKSYFQRIDPKPMTDLQAMYFLAGRAHHGHAAPPDHAELISWPGSVAHGHDEAVVGRIAPTRIRVRR